MNKLLFLITTVTNEKEAKQIANQLVEMKLAACVSFKKISSVYKWEGKIQNDEEIELSIKSKPENLNALIEILKEEIKFEVPQIIYKLFDSEINYLNWVKKSAK